MADSLVAVISQRFTRWQRAAAFAPALLLLVYLPAQVMVRCRMDGLLRPECCCPQEQQEQEQPAGPSVEGEDCCARVVADNQRPEADVARSTTRDLAPTATLAVGIPAMPLLSPALDRFDRASQRYGPAREGPPLVLLKHAFLI